MGRSWRRPAWAWSSVSTDDAPAGLGAYIAALVARLGEVDEGALSRLRSVVGGRTARIGLDAEAVDVTFGDGGLMVTPSAAQLAVDGAGSCDRATVLDLLDGYLEVSDAVLDGRLQARGDDQAVTAIFQAIEILLDAAARDPGLRALAAAYRSERHGGPPRARLPAPDASRQPWLLSESPGEEALLAALDLLPDAGSG